MLNPTLSNRDMNLDRLSDSDWHVGDAPGRWDVSFTDRLWPALRRWFARETQPQVRIHLPRRVELERRRRAA